MVLIGPSVVLIYPRVRMVDVTVLVGHCWGRSVHFLKTAGVFISGQDAVVSPSTCRLLARGGGGGLPRRAA